MRELPKVLILYNISDAGGDRQDPAMSCRESDEGVLDEVKVVADALGELGTACRTAGVRKLTDIPLVLTSAPERIVFNLVEDLEGDFRDACQVPAVCLAFGKMVTGGDTACLSLTIDKPRAKAVLHNAGVPVPVGILVPLGGSIPVEQVPSGPLIVKPAMSDASEGISASSVFKHSRKGLDDLVRKLHTEFNQPVLIEQYVGEREFSVPLFQEDGSVSVLPITEIDFSAFGPDRPAIFDYSAKWLSNSFECQNVRRIVPARIGEDLAARIRGTALKAWHALGCRDFARVDMRSDSGGQLYVLDVNQNPDLSPDCMFMAALSAESMSPSGFVRTVVANAVERLGPFDRREKPVIIAGGETPAFLVRPTGPEDRGEILRFVEATGCFRTDEMIVAGEVLDDALVKGQKGYYQSLTAESNGRAVGWICFGPTPCTHGTYDIYWMIVASEFQKKGIGTTLLKQAERIISQRGGRLVVIETPSRNLYEPAHRLYRSAGYSEQARIEEFFAEGDDKIIFTRQLAD